MHILYLVSATDNPLYAGRYQLHGRFMTFGQQSFIYDLVNELVKHGETVTLAIEGAERFPLCEQLRSVCRVLDPRDHTVPQRVDLVLIDEGSDKLLEWCPPEVPAFHVVHNPANPISQRLEDRCLRFVCLTEQSFARLAMRHPVEKLVVIHQGVDLDRFSPDPAFARPDMSRLRILIYSRLDENRQPTIWRLLEHLEMSNMRITLLGDGNDYWSFCDRFGFSITPVHFIPCTSIQNFLPNFDVVISSARGVMEALAMGLPALCGGDEYAGPVSRDNIGELLERNITGVGMGIDPERVCDDVRSAASLEPATCRELAEDYCSAQTFVVRLLQTLSEANAERARRTELG